MDYVERGQGHTAFAMKGDEARLRAAGCDAYIAKPIDVARFACQVEAALGTGPPMDLDTLRGELADR
jgi:two-component system cell cycle response regulator DivK